MSSRKLILRAFAVVVMGGIAEFVAPPAGATVLGRCEACLDSCPGDLEAWCQARSCGGLYASCQYVVCTDPNGTYDYYVNCQQM